MENVYFYGERGIVNGLVLDIHDNPELIKAVLHSVDWCIPGPSEWVEEIENVTFLVEPSFSEFGQPDLVIVCNLRDNLRRYLFVEAKVSPYSGSSMSNKKGMVKKGYNSSINGQLSLDYRLALALEDYRGGRELAESQEVFATYKEQLMDTNSRPRRSVNPQIIGKIVKPHLQGLEIATTFFVALTRDTSSNQFNRARDDKKPMLLDSNGRNRWEELAGNFGFLSLERLDTEILDMDGHFRRSCRTFIGDWSRNMNVDNFEGHWFRFVNWAEFPTQFVHDIDKVANCVSDQVSAFCTRKRYNGSYSFIIYGKTFGKLAPHDTDSPELMVGFSIAKPSAEQFAKKLGEPKPYLLGPGKEPFLMVAADPANQGKEICEAMVAFLKETYSSNE